jgi:hypothetical protein
VIFGIGLPLKLATKAMVSMASSSRPWEASHFCKKRGRLSCLNKPVWARRRETHRRLGKGEDKDSNDPAEEDKTTEGVH